MTLWEQSTPVIDQPQDKPLWQSSPAVISSPPFSPDEIGKNAEQGLNQAAKMDALDPYDKQVQYFYNWMKSASKEEHEGLALSRFSDPLGLRSWLSRKFGTGEEAAYFEAMDAYVDELPWTSEEKWRHFAVGAEQAAATFKGMGVAKTLPGIATQFGVYETIQAPRQDETLLGRLGTIAKGAAFGTAAGAAGRFIPKARYRIPTTVGGAALVTAIGGGSAKQIVDSGVQMFGWEAIGLAQRGAHDFSLVQSARRNNPELNNVPAKEILQNVKHLADIDTAVKESAKPPEPSIERRLYDELVKRAESGEPEAQAALKQFGEQPTKPAEGQTATEPTIDQLETPVSATMKLVDKIKELKSPDLPLSEKIKAATVGKITQVKDTLTSGIDNLKKSGVVLFNSVKTGQVFKPTVSDMEGAIGDYTGGLQVSSLEAKKLAATIRKNFPDPVRREAIVNYIQAGGDLAELQRMANVSKGARKKGYTAALKLTKDEIKLADSISQYFDEKLDLAIRSGMLEHGVENYVNQVWAKENATSKTLKSDIAAGQLQPNPSLVKKRIFASYFEGEQAGFEPKNKDIGYLVTLYDQAFNRAMAGRAFIKNLHDVTMPDGRPMVAVSGYGKQIGTPGETDVAYLLRPKIRPQETEDYRIIDHPALRKWKWITQDPTKAPIFMQGDLLVHPDAYNQLKNLLKTSAIRQSKIGRAALKVQATLKGTLLSLSGFHQTQIGIHAVFHKVNPFNVPEIDFADPLQKSLVNRGVIVSDYKNMELFYEGMSGGGLLTKIPGLGGYLQKYTDYLFTDYIPRVKMQMAKEAYVRNVERYSGKLTNDEILSLTADQSNAAFGELNYAKLGRNPTTQDALRLTFLAPDFLEARGRFVGQALKPYGREQAAALIRGALGMYVAARIANKVLDDDWHWDKPFSLVVGEDEIQLRSVPGDIVHLISDPRSFVYHRLNPVFIRPIMEAITGRDQYGHFKTTSEQITDYVTGFVPIPLQGLSDPEKKIWESFLTSIGASTYKTKTGFEKTLTDKVRNRITVTMTPESREHYLLINQYSNQWRDALKDGNKVEISELKKKILADAEAGKLYKEDVVKIIDYVQHDKVERIAKQATAEELVDAWSEATESQKVQYEPILKEKIFNLRKDHPERFKELLPKIKKAVGI